MTEKELKHLFQDAKDIADTDKFPISKILLLGNGGISKEVDFSGLDEFSIRLKIKAALLEAIGKETVGEYGSSKINKTGYSIIQFE